MEHYLLAPLYALVAKERPRDPEDLSAANLVALRLLTGSYLGKSYASWGVCEVVPGHWCLAQSWDGGVVDRDVFEPFYPPAFGFDEGDDEFRKDLYVVGPPPGVNKAKDLVSGEAHVPLGIRQRADAMLGRLRSSSPDAVSLLLEPTTEQLIQRQKIAIETVKGRDLGDMLRPIIGDWGDWTLRAYGIKYHGHSHASPDDVYIFAHNGMEVCGVMKLGTSRKWGYGVSYVSVSPGFRGQGLSLKLYQAALDKCLEDEKVLVRSDPGDDTPPQATLAYDRMVKSAPVLHTTSYGPFAYPLEMVCEKGWDYATLVSRLKEACDDALPSPQQRMERYTGGFDYQFAQALRERHAESFEELLAASTPAPAKKAPMRP